MVLKNQPESRIRVLQLVSLAIGTPDKRGAGGPEIRAAESLRFWDDRRCEIFLSYSSAGQLIEEFRAHPRWIDFAVDNRNRLQKLKRLTAIVEEYRIDLIHTQGPVYTDFIATVAAGIKGIRNVVTRPVQVSDLKCGWLKGRILRSMDAYTKRHCSSMVAISETGRQCLIREGCPPNKIVVVYNGVDTNKYRPDVPPSIPRCENEFAIGMFAQMVSHKRQDLLIRALGLSRRHGRRWRLHLVGDGPERRNLEAITNEMGLGGFVTFHGFSRDLPGLYTSVDVVALASEREGLPVTLLEGMASGCACLASDIGGVRELLGRNDTGVVVGENSEDAFFKATASLEDDPIKVKELGRRARTITVDRFSIQQMVSGYERLYGR